MSIFARNRPEVRVRVAWPWKIAFADTAVCAPVQCAVGKDFIVYANDADMHARRLPSRNIIIDEVPSEGSPCP